LETYCDEKHQLLEAIDTFWLSHCIQDPENLRHNHRFKNLVF